MFSPAEKAVLDFANFHGVIGLVDGTHVRIQRPCENEADYVNDTTTIPSMYKLCVYLMVDFAMSWRNSQAQSMIHVYGNCRVLEVM